ncbi:MAG: adenylate/guanylate cyclase domain-containing protein [Alphaproteobacteria bacterium]|nr:adenylate/guanylate cyclase domain-containing protein [Alphaproteobacteria bacterium]
MDYPIPGNEAERLAALETYNVAGTPPEMDFDQIAEIAAKICECPVAAVNVVDDKWEWYKGKCGIPEHVNSEPRGGICCTTICSSEMLVVPDLTEDPRFADQQTVRDRPHFRFYAGMPMINQDGYALGTLCVLDFIPRRIDDRQVEALRFLTHQAVTQLELRRKIAELDKMRETLAEEKQRADTLLDNILPGNVAEELKAEGQVRPRYYDQVTILFTDFKGFTRLTEGLEPRALVEELNAHFSAFDDIVARHGLEKLKTIGDAYMCAAGLPEPSGRHALDAAATALAIRDHMARVNAQRAKMKLPLWEIRIGLHSGGVMAGVVGKRKFAFDIWGDAVNVAALMEANANPGEILLSAATCAKLAGQFETEPRGEIDTAKKGRIRCHVLKGPKIDVA